MLFQDQKNILTWQNQDVRVELPFTVCELCMYIDDVNKLFST